MTEIQNIAPKSPMTVSTTLSRPMEPSERILESRFAVDSIGRPIGDRNYQRGEHRHNAKLTAQQVITIRNSTEKNASLAAEYGVSEGTIEHAKKRRTWKQLK